MFLNTSVRTKHLIIIAIVCASFLLAGLIGGLFVSRLNHLHDTALQLSELHNDMLSLRRHEKDFLYRNDQEARSRHRQTYEAARQHLEQLHSDLIAHDIPVDGIEQIGARLREYVDEFNRLAERQAESGAATTDGKLAEAMRTSVRSTESVFEQQKEKLHGLVGAALQRGQVMLGTMLAVCALLCSALIYWVSQSINRPLAQLSEQVGHITRNRDLTVRLPVTGNDEISEVSRSLNELLETLHGTVLEVQDSAQMVASSAEEMANITRDVRQATANQSREVELAVVAVNEMSSTIQEIARNAAGAADSVGNAHQQLQAGSETGGEARREIERLTEEVQEVVDAIQTLSEHSNNIGQVLDAIRAVAEQTNLLALNAAIEAARAGDQGRGFAVVADEVRTLAKKTQDSTETIRQTIQQLQQGTLQAVGTVDRASLRATQGIEHVSRTARTLNDIAGNVSSISDLNLQIAAAAEQQSVAAEEISRNVVRVTDLSREVAGQAEQTAYASEELAKLGTRLKDLVRRFRV